MTTRESSTVALITRHLQRKYGAFVFKTHGDAKRAGLPDLIACIRGRYVAIEVKAPDAKRGATKRQLAELVRITRSGGIAFVASSTAEVDMALLHIGATP